MQKNDNGKNIFELYADIFASKNPFKMFMTLKILKDAFNDVSDNLVNSVELTLSQNAKQEYLNIIELYSKEHFFRSIYNFYLTTGSQNKISFKDNIDNYFDNSFFSDLPFFYGVLIVSENFKYAFEALYFISSKPIYYENYKNYSSYFSKKFYIKSIIKNVSNLKTERDIFFLISLIDTFKNYNFATLSGIKYNFSEKDIINFITKLTIESLKGKNKKHKEFFVKNFADNSALYKEYVENMKQDLLIKPISIFRSDILNLSKINANFSTILDYDFYKTLDSFVEENFKLKNKNIGEKIDFLLKKAAYYESLNQTKKEIFELSFKKKVMERIDANFIEHTLGITHLPKDAFYKLKNITKEVSTDNLFVYNELKELILYAENNYFVSFFRPFLYRNFLNSKIRNDNKYYLTKFITTIILAKNYKEYSNVSSFYGNIEAFIVPGLKGFFMRLMQYGWLYLLGILLFFIAPFGVLVAILIYVLKEITCKIIEKFSPEMKMNMNFQLGTFATGIGVFALFLAFTTGFEDNVKLTYENFKGTINSMIIPSYEVVGILGNNLKTSVNDLENGKNKMDFGDINYLKGESLYKIRYENEENIELNSAPENNISNIFTIDKNRTFYDYAKKFAIDCGKNNDTFIMQKLELFLESEKFDLLKYIPNSNTRLTPMAIPKYLPKIDYDLTGLKNLVCEK